MRNIKIELSDVMNIRLKVFPCQTQSSPLSTNGATPYNYVPTMSVLNGIQNILNGSEISTTGKRKGIHTAEKHG